MISASPATYRIKISSRSFENYIFNSPEGNVFFVPRYTNVWGKNMTFTRVLKAYRLHFFYCFLAYKRFGEKCRSRSFPAHITNSPPFGLPPQPHDTFPQTLAIHTYIPAASMAILQYYCYLLFYYYMYCNSYYSTTCIDSWM